MKFICIALLVSSFVADFLAIKERGEGKARRRERICYTALAILSWLLAAFIACYYGVYLGDKSWGLLFLLVISAVILPVSHYLEYEFVGRPWVRKTDEDGRFTGVRKRRKPMHEKLHINTCTGEELLPWDFWTKLRWTPFSQPADKGDHLLPWTIWCGKRTSRPALWCGWKKTSGFGN